MPRILFFAEAVSLAHVARPVQLASTLGPEWEIEFACADEYGVCFKGTDWQRHYIASVSPNVFMKRLARGSPLYVQNELDAYVHEDISLIRNLEPDTVVGDFRLSLSVAARIARVPYISICNAHWSPWAGIGRFPLPDIPLTAMLGPRLAWPLFQVGLPFAFKMHAAPLNAIRKRYNLPALPDIRSIYTDGDMTLYADVPSLVPTRHLPDSHRYIGPILWSPNIAEPPWWKELPDEPIAYVTMGSTGNVELLPTLMETLEGAGYITIVATAGRSDIISIPGRRFVAKFLPGEIAVDRAEIVICNGGSATVYQALSRGKCVLGICSNMDQFLTMGCVERIGAGLTVRASGVSQKLLAKAIRRLTAQNNFHVSALKVQAEFSNYPSRVLFPEALAALSAIKEQGAQNGTLAEY
jgi:UDP:flavonoid glycosyltransferase YjiC (YdhE family)